jgi:hypothetical protein
MESCPVCRGVVENVAIMCSRDKCEMRMVTCSFCDGAGEVSKEAFERYARRHHMRELRVKRGFTQRSIAGIFKISDREFNDFEMGRGELAAGVRSQDCEVSR